MRSYLPSRQPRKISQNEEISVALEDTGFRRIAEGSLHDKVSDMCAVSPTSWCGLNLLGQALECTREMLRQNTSGSNLADTLASRDDDTDDIVFKVDPITHVRLARSPLNAPTHVTQLSVFTDSVPDTHDPKVP